MQGLKILFGTAALLAGMVIAPAAQGQIVVNFAVEQPSCAYGYYGYAPYHCAPQGYYGAGYFYNGIFLGIGPWGGWGYDHGWGDHRFAGEGGGRYHGGPGRMTYYENRGRGRNENRGRDHYASGGRDRGNNHERQGHGNKGGGGRAEHAAVHRGDQNQDGGGGHSHGGGDSQHHGGHN